MSGSFEGRKPLDGIKCDACGDPASTSNFINGYKETVSYSLSGKLEAVHLCPTHWRGSPGVAIADITAYRIAQKALRKASPRIGRFEAILQEIEFQEK